MPAKDGTDYKRRIDSGGTEVWIDGTRAGAPLSEHPLLRGVIESQARLYDAQLVKGNAARMLYASPTSGDMVGLSYLRPETKKDLARRRRMMEVWAGLHHGFLGRSPDYMNTAIMTMASASELLGLNDPRFADNARKYYEYCRERDITLTHVFLRPQYNRSAAFMDSFEDGDMARVVDENSDGIVVSGTFMLATQGGITDEILVFPLPCPSVDADRNPYAFAFALPCSTKGIRFQCREGYDGGRHSRDYPLTSRFEEPDAIVTFDQVAVPWDRVFLYGDRHLANAFFWESHFYAHVGHQVVIKNIAKSEFMVGTLQLMIDALGIEAYGHVQEKMSEALITLETMRSLLAAAEQKAELDRWGTMKPHPNSIHAAITCYPKLYPRLAEIVQQIGASGMILLPTQRDLAGERGNALDRELATSELEGSDKVKLFRLAWDMTMSPFGSRQTQYERFFFGDYARSAARLYYSYDRDDAVDRVSRFLDGM